MILMIVGFSFGLFNLLVVLLMIKIILSVKYEANESNVNNYMPDIKQV